MLLTIILTFLFAALVLFAIEHMLSRGGMYGTPYKVPRRWVYHDTFFSCLFDTIRIFTWLKIELFFRPLPPLFPDADF